MQMAALLMVFLFQQPELIQHFFVFKGTAEAVSVAGSFNNWSASAHKALKTDSGWVAQANIPAGHYYYKFVVDGKWIPDPSHSWRINDGGSSWNSIVKVGNPPVPKRKTSNIPFDSTRVPVPIYPSRPDFVQLYYAAWRMAWQKIETGNTANGFVEKYMDEGFNELIYQWDTCFMTAFGVYGNGVFPAMESLDNFYRKQRSDGYIQRVYFESDGRFAGEPTADEPMVNPPLFAWLEWRYFTITGDRSRLQRVFPILKNYFFWLHKNVASGISPDLYYSSELGSGMDNTPRPGVHKGGWIDQSAQMALFAKNMRDIAGVLKLDSEKAVFSKHAVAISAAINKHAWSASSGFYHDVGNDGKISPVLHIGGFWPLLSGSARSSAPKKLAEKLSDPRFFNRPHRVPTLSFSDPKYEGDGHYWLGGIWAPTNYMVVQGLNQVGMRTLADSIAQNHLNNMSAVFKKGITDPEKLDFEQRFADGYHTIWEAYAPEKQEPATRWDDTFYTRQDFTGWSALSPIAMFIEQIIGLETLLSERKIVWHLSGKETRGIQNYKPGTDEIQLLAEPDSLGWQLTIRTKNPFDMVVKWENKSIPLKVEPERTFYQIR